MALSDSVLIVSCYGANTIVPVDIRGAKPATDWRLGASIDNKALTAGLSKGDDGSYSYQPIDVACADGRLFVADALGAAVCLIDVAMDPKARSAPISTDGTPLVVFTPVRVIAAGGLAIPGFRTPYGVTAIETPAGVRVFVCESNSNKVAELTREGSFVREYVPIVQGIFGGQTVAVSDGRLFFMGTSSNGVVVFSLLDDPQRDLKTGQDLGWALDEETGRRLNLVTACGLVVIGDVMVVCHQGAGFLAILQLSHRHAG
jgi:hypothetical protein